jgi:hypothetical protein
MGIYAVTPGIPEWSVTQSSFDSIKVTFEDKTTKEISKKMAVRAMENFGINSNYKDIAVGYSYDEIIPVPVIQAEGKAFKDSLTISLSNKDNIKMYYYSEDLNGNRILLFKEYEQPFEINSSQKIHALTMPKRLIEPTQNYTSKRISATFYKKPNNYSIEIKSKYNPQYTAGGDEGIIDGINGTENWRKGEWQGYQSQDFEAIIDLQIEKNVSNFSSTFLQDSGSWILMPTKVDYFVSNDNVNFTLVGSVNNSISPKYSVNKIENFEYQSPQEIKAKYVKVKAYNFGKLPDWHQGAGGDAFIFIDEITIK